MTQERKGRFSVKKSPKYGSEYDVARIALTLSTVSRALRCRCF